MTHITDYGGAIDDYYPKKMERIVDITEHERAADIEAESARMSAEALDGGWQLIGDDKPEPGVDVLLYGTHGGGKKMVQGKTATFGFWVDDPIHSFNPTHWRYMPEPPK